MTLLHVMSCMLATLLSTCGSQVGHSYVGHISPDSSVGQWSNKGMQVAMIPALISKGIQAMHHDHSINQTF